MSPVFVNADLQRHDQRPTPNMISVFLSLPTHIMWMGECMPSHVDEHKLGVGKEIMKCHD